LQVGKGSCQQLGGAAAGLKSERPDNSPGGRRTRGNRAEDQRLTSLHEPR